MLQTCSKCGKQFYGVGCPECDYPPSPEDPGRNKRNWIFGILFMASGIGVTVAVLTRPHSEPTWPVVVAGLLFVLAGLTLVTNIKGRPAALLGCLIMAGLASLGFFAAFGPGDVGGGIPFLPSAWNQRLGRIAFGAGACLTAVCALLAFYQAVKPDKKKGAPRTPPGINH